LFDAFVANVDRDTAQPNLLTWHSKVWAHRSRRFSLLHHGWRNELEGSDDPFREVRHHVLLPWATSLRDAASAIRGALGSDMLDRVVAELPRPGSQADATFGDAEAHRAAYPDVGFVRA